MKYLLLLSIFFFSIGIYAQNSQEDKTIIESFLNEMLKKDFAGIEKIRIIPKFKNSKDNSYKGIIAFKKDIEEINNGLYHFPYDLLRGKILKEKFRKNPRFIQSLYNLVSDFNNHPKIEVNKLNLKKKVKLTSDSYSFFSNLFQKNNKKTIRKVKFSRIQHTGDLATFYCSYICGDLCGFGGFIFMEKVNDKWIFLGTFEMWVS